MGSRLPARISRHCRSPALLHCEICEDRVTRLLQGSADPLFAAAPEAHSAVIAGPPLLTEPKRAASARDICREGCDQSSYLRVCDQGPVSTRQTLSRTKTTSGCLLASSSALPCGVAVTANPYLLLQENAESQAVVPQPTQYLVTHNVESFSCCKWAHSERKTDLPAAMGCGS